MLLRLITRRLLFSLYTLLAVAIFVFIVAETLPGSAAQAMLGQSATPETVAALERELGLDQPAIYRFFYWLTNMLQGDFGISYSTRTPVVDQLALRLPPTLMLGGLVTIIAVPTALLLGLICAIKPGTIIDRGINTLALCLISIPDFLLATLLVVGFAVTLQWLPAISSVTPDMSTVEVLRALALPAATLALIVIAPMVRMTRNAVINVLSQPSIEMAMLKGVPPRRIIMHHALPNALGPIVNVISINLAYLLSGVIIVEFVFAYPGVAKFMVDGVASRNMPVVQACAIFFCTVYIGLNLFADVVAMVANPRLRHPK
ncbi:MAG: ABC transporter permease [Alphaproteobacteria bacterium]|nr:ABC transporter permease [Alphaproteobacteria bacterium SS10]